MLPTRARLSDGRWHFQHGPIDLIIGGDGDGDGKAAHFDQPAFDDALEACWALFQSVLTDLVGQLPMLRTPLSRVSRPPTLMGDRAVDLRTESLAQASGPARRMVSACLPYCDRFITPMAAVAGAVADHLIGCFARPGIARAYINNGGDIALYLAPGQAYAVGVVAQIDQVSFGAQGVEHDAALRIDAHDPVRGIATSGWRGRSFSLGIADAVTVLARDAASADAAATMIANEVDLDHPCIVRRPASSLKDDTDLGERLVTVDVPPLSAAQVDRALQRGARRACELQAAGLIHSALLVCQRRFVSVAPPVPAELGMPLPIARDPARHSFVAGQR